MTRRKVKNGEKSPWGQCLTQENNLRKRRLGTIMLFCKADISYDHTSYILNVNLGSMEQF